MMRHLKEHCLHSPLARTRHSKGKSTSHNQSLFTMGFKHVSEPIVRQLSQSDEEKAWSHFVRCVASHHLPLNLINSEDFWEFVHILNPQIRRFRRDKLSQIVTDEATKVANELVRIFECAESVSFTTDTCTLRSLGPVIAVTGHFIDDNFKLHSYVVGFKDMKGEWLELGLVEIS